MNLLTELMLQDIFKSLANQFTDDQYLIDSHWEEIETQYSTEGRFYHNLTHLESVLQELVEVKENIEDWYAVLFTLFYHDLIYHVLQKNNEESSAELAATRLFELKCPPKIIETTRQQILATKLHELSEHSDTNWFNDADLSILGQPTSVYTKYMEKVRNEYKIYPAVIYNKGREDVLRHFLRMPRIFKTDHFHEKYEYQAKVNMEMEVILLSRRY